VNAVGLRAGQDPACHNTIIVGGGQTGLCLGYFLSRAGDDFLILDAGEAVGDSWRNRYDSLKLFTPTQYDSLPGLEFPGRRDTYPTKDTVADYIANYAARFRLPVQLNTSVTRVSRSKTGFIVETSRGVFTACQVVIATGIIQRPLTPAFAARLSSSVFQTHSAEYRNPKQLAPGDVLVVGAGNSGAQIAVELSHDRKVYLAIGKEPRCVPQRFLGRDYLWWVILLGMMDATPNSWPWGRRIRATNSIVGMELLRLIRRGHIVRKPRVAAAEGEQILFADGSRQRFSNVIWATGYDHDFSLVDAPVFDSHGKLIHQRGATTVEGLYFLGQRWLHTGGSGFIGFVGRDAEYLAARMTPRAGAAASRTVVAKSATA